MLKKIKKAVSFNRPIRPKTELSEEDIINGKFYRIFDSCKHDD
jgi:hypothetical protein